MRPSSLAFSLTFFAALPALADDAGLARALGEQGGAAVLAGDYEKGCPKLEEAWRLDPQLLGVGMTLATCYERQAKLFSAWNVVSSVAGKARARGEKQRTEEAQARADALKPRLSLLTIVVPESVSKLDGLVVLRDGQAVGAPTFGAALPIDGGKHQVSAAAVGRSEWKGTVEVPAERGNVVLTLGEPLLEQPKVVAPLPPSPPPPPPPEGIRPITVGAVTLGIVGAVTMGIGVGLGVQANEKYQAAQGCTGNVCLAAGLEQRRDALTIADAGTGAFVVGAVVGATGLVLGIVAGVTGKKPATASLHRLELRF